MNEQIKNAILNKVYERDEKQYISLGNYALDFSKEYLFLGFTNKTVKLAWINGRDLIKVQGKIKKTDFGTKLYTEAWSFIETLEVE